jgi:hypothetical protein
LAALFCVTCWFFAALFSSTYKHLAALFCAAYGFLQPCFLLCTDTWLPCTVPLTGFCIPLLFYLGYWYLQPCFVLFSCICSPAIFFSPKMCAIFCTPCTRDCSLRFAILFLVTAHLCSKQGSILEQIKAKQHTNCWL